jgi:hypothetical protein
MRNTNRCFDLWQIRSSDYPADMRKSIPDQEMWQSDLFAPRCGAGARLARHVFRAVKALELNVNMITGAAAKSLAALDAQSKPDGTGK